MKRKLLTVVLLIALGHYYPDITERVVAWWQAPPPPPSEEAQRLIVSLDSGDGWKLTHNETTKAPRLTQRDVTLYLMSGGWKWSPSQVGIYIDGANCSDQFSTSDREYIARAFGKRLRKLTAKSLEAASAEKTAR